MRRITRIALLPRFHWRLLRRREASTNAATTTRFGDVSCCTRDLTDVVVRNDDAGTITFDIHYDATYEGDDDDDLYVFLETDRNQRTGVRQPGLCVDYQISAHVGSRGADDVSLNDHPTKLIQVTVTGTRILVSFDRHLIDDSDGFRFKVAVWEVTSLGGAYADVAPDGQTAWSFPVRIARQNLRPSLTTRPARRARPCVGQ
jgi:hypothetical protein